MHEALYYPFSRCLDDLALKRAVLLYDRLLFVDPVDPVARADLYLREGRAAGADPELPKRWLAAAADYELLNHHGVVATVDRTVLRDGRAIDALVAAGLRLDLDVNDARHRFFARKRSWQMLERRLPPAAHARLRLPVRRSQDFFGERILQVPYAVGASVTLTYALTIAHELGVAPITEHAAHSQLLRSRLQSAALSPTGLPGIYQHADTPYKRRQVELRVAGMLAPASVLRKLSMQDILDYRDAHPDARHHLTRLMDRLSDEARHRPWDRALDDELDEIAEKTREIADGLPGWGSALAAAKASAATPSKRLQIAVSTGLTAYVAPHTPLLAALATGVFALGTAMRDVAMDAYDQLRRARTPEENAVATCWMPVANDRSSRFLPQGALRTANGKPPAPVALRVAGLAMANAKRATTRRASMSCCGRL